MSNENLIIFDGKLSKVVEFSEQGLDQDALLRTVRLVADLEQGKVDTISFRLAPGNDPRAAKETLQTQLHELFSEQGFAEPPNGARVIQRYVGLHSDVRSYATEDHKPILRFHTSDGFTQFEPNIPQGVDRTQFDAFFLLGRMGPGADMDLRRKDMGNFTPSLMIDQSEPSFTLFRLIIEAGMQAGATFSAVSGKGEQTVTLGDSVLRVTENPGLEGFFGRSADGQQIGITREFEIEDFSRASLRNL